MAVVPRTRIEKVQFFQDHITPFQTNATALGLTTTEVSDLETKANAARAGYDEMKAKRQAAEAATNAFYDLVDIMNVAGQGALGKIRIKAETTGNPSLYSLAEIPPPATPTSVGAPGTPFKFKVALKPNGSLEMKWKCNNPAGCTNVIYQIYRKIESTGAYEYLGGAGAKEFVDITLPAGVPSVMYQIQGTRSTAIGDAAEFVVNFGVNAGTGAATASIATGTPAKIAA